MAQVIKDVVTWLKQWFPEKGEVVAKSQGSGNASKNVVTDASGDVTLENKVSVGTGLAFDGTVANKINHSNSVTAQTSAVAKKIKYDGQGHITGTSTLYGSDIAVSSSDSTKINTALSNKANSTHTHSVTDVTDSNAHSHIGTSANATQGAINTAIDSKLSELVDINFVTVVQTLPTASQSTMGKIYLVPSDSTDTNDNYEEYVTIKDGNTYSWEKFGEVTDISVAWNDITGKPSFSTVATSGSYNDLSNKPTIPDVSGKIDTAGTGLSKSGTTINHNDNVTSAQSTPVFKKFSYDKQGHITGTADVQVTDFPHSHNATGVIDANAHSNLGTSANANQGAINTAIDTTIGNKISKSSTTGLVKNDGSIDTSSYVTSSDISGKSDKTATIGTTITLVDKGETNEGCIIFNTIS